MIPEYMKGVFTLPMSWAGAAVLRDLDGCSVLAYHVHGVADGTDNVAGSTFWSYIEPYNWEGKQQRIATLADADIGKGLLDLDSTGLN